MAQTILPLLEAASGGGFSNKKRAFTTEKSESHAAGFSQDGCGAILDQDDVAAKAIRVCERVQHTLIQVHFVQQHGR
jgi:hypothetical protein